MFFPGAHVILQIVLRTGLIYLLVLADKQQLSEAPGARWENYYADLFVGRYLR